AGWDPATFSVAAPPLATRPCPFAIYVLPGARARTVPTEQPLGLGTMGFPTLLTGGEPQPITLANNFTPSRPRRLGAPVLASDPAPSIVATRPRGIGKRIRLTLQGFIVDPGSAGPGVSITNAIFLTVK